MIFEELKEIELSGEKYPIKCDLLVLEQLQEEFGSVADFENKLLGIEYLKDAEGEYIRDKEGKRKANIGIPDTKAINKGLYLMVREGLEIKGGAADGKTLSREGLLRKVDKSYTEISKIVHEAFAECFEGKNGKATQGTN
ncbi:hypothetical protein [Murimonas intestini]|uniref:Uncharacterized protein n=1 Tax=Murimonas intestini TaxID=1337051 RepID=A0AB73SZH7_9FIRM|nr:hypothetical protein [Murimonas intestini]MCR1842755.1 hypothetical protein [Murimonas intestini]MCR1867906.1 hypothetical protein [Murimonas intestini]MCR1885258.1 hypothetical protein [Murimonas intestini]